MADTSKGTITFKGDRGNPDNNYAKTQIVGVIDETSMNTLATALAAHTECNIAKVNLTLSTGVTDAAPGVNANVDRKAIYYLRDSADLSVHPLTLPAPPIADVEELAQGDRVTAAALASVVAAINAATGKVYTGMYGVVIGKR